ncbi:MAG: Druantia anti-phage system protein DruA [Gemmatimonadales bacterium]
MDAVLSYRGRPITRSDLAFLREVIATQPALSRRALSFAVCAAWQWTQPNGTPCDGVCRGLLVVLHRAGHLVLPPARWRTTRPWRPRTGAPPVGVDTSPLAAALCELRPLEIRQVRRTVDEGLFNSLLAQYHYLGYQQPVGAHLKYLVWAAGRPVACAAWASAPRHLGPRDRFIGWAADARRRNVRFVAYNSRFLILPWVTVPHLASHVLGRLAARVSPDWQRLYAHPIYFVETFIDPARFRGTCYRAANWRVLGRTTGRGHNAPTMRPTQPVKEVLGYPLVPDFRTRLTRMTP